MIRKQDSPTPLFCLTGEIAMPSRRNFYVRLRAAVDWRRLASPLAPAFSECEGRPTDPAVYLKLFVVAYLENITHDTELAARAADSIAIREFLGYDLTEMPPDHSSISRNRARIGEHCDVAAVLEQTVRACAQAGLVGPEAAVDSSLVPANASLDSLRSKQTGERVREHLRAVREQHRETGEHRPVEVSNAEFRSESDPDARVAKKRGQPRDLAYKVTHVTDGAAGVILAADCARADVGDADAAGPVIAAAQETLAAAGGTLETVLADAGYDDADFHAALEDLGVTPLTHIQPDTGGKPAGFRKADFRYDEATDCYTCPAGQPLRCAGHKGGGLRQYRSRTAECRPCPHRSQCLARDSRQRTITRLVHEESRQRAVARADSAAGRAALRRRCHIVEPPFGHMKSYGGLRLMNCRGLGKAKVKAVLAAVAWDLRKLVAALARRQPARASADHPAGRLCSTLAGFIGALMGHRLLGRSQAFRHAPTSPRDRTAFARAVSR
jgi:transposase